METTSGTFMFHVFGALSEFERNLIKKRTLAGLEAARARGRQGGRPEKLNDAGLTKNSSKPMDYVAH